MKENILTILCDSSNSYVPRTKVNAKESDCTIAFAIDPNSPGEILTKKSCLKYGKPFISINPLRDSPITAYAELFLFLKRFWEKEIVLNIAGNGIFTMKGEMKQIECDLFVYRVLRTLIQDPKMKAKIIKIRSGGQTGFDESGIKTGITLEIPTLAYFPAGHRIRTMEGDIYPSLEETLKRFTKIEI